MSDIVRKLLAWVNECNRREDLQKLLIAFLLLMSVIQIGFYSYTISLNTDTIPIVDSSDWDAARGIETTIKSGWLSDNGWRYYGNLYYRVSHTMAHLGFFFSDVDYSDKYTEEKIIHFSTMFVSLLSVLMFSILISVIIAESNVKRLFIFIVLNSAIMSNNLWVMWIFKTHPDVFLSVLTAFGFYFLLKYMESDNPKVLLGASILWGMALASKMNTLLYLPMILVAFLPRKLELKVILRCMLFYFGILAVYFLVGIPQNFKVTEMFRALTEVGSSGKPATLESMFQVVQYIKDETFIVLIPVVILSLLADTKIKLSINSLTKGLMICCGVVGYYMFTDSIIRREHYFFPIASVILVLMTYSAASFVIYLKTRYQSTVKMTQYMIILCFALILMWVVVIKPKNVIGVVTADNTVSRPYAHVIMQEILKSQKDKKLTYVDPYVPYDRDLGHIVYSDSPTDTKVDLKKVDKLVFSVWYSERFAADSGCIEWEMKRPDWREVREFYRRFGSKDLYSDMFGQKWVKDKELSNQFWTIWNKQ